MKRLNPIGSGVLKCVLVLILALPCLAVLNRPAIKVTTKLGRVIGTEETIGIEDGFSPENGATRRFFHSFRGIPYAKAPIGDLRWKVKNLFKLVPNGAE